MKKFDIVKIIFLYFTIRLFSYFFTPVTPLLTQHPLNTLVSFLILTLSTYWIFKKDERGWYIVALEIILGGSGGYLKLGFISLRTALLLASTAIFFIQKISSVKIARLKQTRLESIIIVALIGVAGLAALRGLYLNHGRSAVFSDFIPYLFLLYYFPLCELWLSDKFRALGKHAIVAAIFGNALMILATQVGLSSGLFILQDNYYHWYRDVALGKITDLNLHFYRLVLNEHLLLIPLTLYFLGDIIKNKINKTNFSVLFSLLFILANNLTRIYIVALAVGIIILFSFKKWRCWLVTSIVTAVGFMLIFVTAHTLASRGQSFGLEIFGLRLQSITSPQMEESSLSRLLLLPKILEEIKLHPILGNGLGDTVTVYSPIFKTTITTPNFDWGYLEIFAEMGLLGTIVWIALVWLVFYKITRNSHKYHKHILSAMLIGFLVINITSPALFHVFGIILLITLLSPFGLKYRQCAGGIVIDKNGRIVLVNNKDINWWSPPKGGIEKGEDALRAAKREIFEETGLANLEYIKDLGSFNQLFWNGNKYKFKNITLFLFKTSEIQLLSHDVANPEARWFTYEDCLQVIKTEDYKNIISKIKHDLI